MSGSRKYFNSQQFIKNVEHTITGYRMLQSGDSVLVSVSGGPDSVVLLHCLLALAPDFSLKLGVAHLNHCLRGEESDRDAEFVADLAEKHGLLFYGKKEDVRKFHEKTKLSMEEAARKIRYEFLSGTAEKQGFDKIAMGHNSDDNAELILMYLIRGSGPLGISGIPPVRDNVFIRPLIKSQRSGIMKFLEAEGLHCVYDSSNSDTEFFRNRVRHELLPVLKSSYNPNIIETLNRLGSILRCEEDWIDDVIRPVFDKAVTAYFNKKLILSVSGLAGMHRSVKRRVLRKAIEKVKGDLRGVTFSHIESVSDLLKSVSVSGYLDLPDQVRVEKYENGLIISRKKHPLRMLGRSDKGLETIDFEYTFFKSGFKPQTIQIKETGYSITFSGIVRDNLPENFNTGQQVAYFDMSKLFFPMVIRNFRQGDRFTPLGMSGTQKLKKFFINNKIPRAQRIKCPILLDDKKIVWITGHRMDESVKIDANTRTILKAELFLA